MTGNAARLAAAKAKEILFEVAAPLLGVKPHQLEARDYKIQVRGFPQRNIHIGDVADRARGVNGQPALGSASFNPATVALDPETGQGVPFATYVYATQIAEVDVDDETGEVEVLRIVASHDCGTPINPMLVEGQVEGGISMGVGFALQEEMLFDSQGRLINPNLTNYHHAYVARHAESRGRHRRQLRSDRSIRRQGCGRADLCGNRGRHPERHSRRGGCPILAACHGRKVHAALKAKRAQESRQLTVQQVTGHTVTSHKSQISGICALCFVLCLGPPALDTGGDDRVTSALPQALWAFHGGRFNHAEPFSRFASAMFFHRSCFS